MDSPELHQAEVLRVRHHREQTPHALAYHEMMLLAKQTHRDEVRVESFKERLLKQVDTIQQLEKQNADLRSEVAMLKKRVEQVAPNSPLENLRIAVNEIRVREVMAALEAVVKAGRVASKKLDQIELIHTKIRHRNHEH